MADAILPPAFQQVFASIDDADTAGGSAVYDISCSTSTGFTWQVKHTYSEFEKAHKALSKTHTHKLPKLPRKRTFHSSTNPTVVAERTEKLNAIVQFAATLVGSSEPVRAFLDLEEAVAKYQRQEDMKAELSASGLTEQKIKEAQRAQLEALGVPEQAQIEALGSAAEDAEVPIDMQLLAAANAAAGSPNAASNVTAVAAPDASQQDDTADEDWESVRSMLAEGARVAQEAANAERAAEEAAAAARAPTREQSDQIFAQFDTDGDGTVDMDELVEMVAAAKHTDSSGLDREKIQQVWDADGSGEVR